MGLDMYLYRKSLQVQEEDKEIAYWRKANAIHKWFVDNCENGYDSNGKKAPVSFEQVKQLLKITNAILKDRSKANELLPTQSGFFFGSEDYDDWYFKQLRYTQKILRELKKKGEYGGIYYYQSSW